MLTQLMSVLGPLSACQLGVTMPHEHTFVNTMREYRGDGLVHDARLLEEELKGYAALGGQTIVDLTSRGLHPQPSRVRDLAEAAGVQIILGTGFYRHPFIDEAWIDRHSTDEVADLLVRDIRVGIDDTGVRAGVLGEIGCDRFLTPVEERSFRAAARAHHETDVSISTHAARWPVGIAQLRLLASEGVAPNRVIVGHCDLVPDPEYPLAIAERGAYVQFDNIQGTSDYELERVIDGIRRLVVAGHRERILLSQDICLRSHLKALGGPGFGYLLGTFVPMLERAGFESGLVRMLTIENPARALTGR